MVISNTFEITNFINQDFLSQYGFCLFLVAGIKTKFCLVVYI